MRTASVSDLKANLSRYLRDVKRGEEVQVLDRGVPVARLVPLSPGRGLEAARWDRLVAAGVLRAGKGDASFVLDHPPVSVPGLDLSAAVAQERNEQG